MTSSERPQLPDDHRLHDRLLIARAVGEDLDPLDRVAADALLEACPGCRTLAAELGALRFAASELPAARRPRDFRLTQAQADRLRGGALQRFLAPLGGPAFGFLQPLAGAAIAIGLGLLVVTSIPLGLGGSAASAPQPEAQYGRTDTSAGEGSTSGSPAGLGSPRLGPVAGQPGASPSSETGSASGGTRNPLATTLPDKNTDAGASAAPAEGPRTSGQPPTPATGDFYRPATTIWPIVGLALALVGFGLFIARGYARRQTEDPLLR
jgi:hypothetical protein